MGQVRQDNVQIKLEIDGSQSRTELDNLTRKAQLLTDGMKGLKKGSEDYVNANKELSQVNARMKDLREEIGLTSLTTGQLRAMAGQLNRELAGLTPNTASFANKAQELANVEGRLAQVRKEAKGIGDELGNAGGGLGDFLKKAVGFAGIQLGVGAIVGELKELGTSSVAEFQQAAGAAAQLDATIASTGASAGFTRQQLLDMSTALEGKTFFDGDAVTQAQSVLLGFQNIKGAVYKDALPAIADMAVKLAGDGEADLTGATKIVGKALENPLAGIQKLTKAGVDFPAGSAEMVKGLLAINDTAGAQRVILNALTAQYGGSAEAAAKAGTGPLKQFEVQIGNVKEGLGELILDGLQALQPALAVGLKLLTFLIEALKATPAFLSENRGAFGLLGAAVLAFNGAQIIAQVGTIRTLALQKLHALGLLELEGETYSLVTAQEALDAALLANPIGIILALLALFAFGLKELYDRSETFRAAVDSVFTALRPLGELFGGLGEKLGPLISQVAKFFGGIGGGKAVLEVFGYLMGVSVVVPLKLVVAQLQLSVDAFLGLLDVGKRVANFFGADFKIDTNGSFAALTKNLKANAQSIGSTLTGTDAKPNAAGSAAPGDPAGPDGKAAAKQAEADAAQQKKADTARAEAAAKSNLEALKAREANIKAALALVQAGSDEELRLKKQEIFVKRDIDLAGEKKTEGDKKVIRAEALRDVKQLEDAAAEKSRTAAEKRAKDAADVEKKIADLKSAALTDETEKKVQQLTAAAEKEKATAKGTSEQIAEQRRLLEQKLALDVAEVRRQAAAKQAEEELGLEKQRNALITNEFDRRAADLRTAAAGEALKVLDTDTRAAEKRRLIQEKLQHDLAALEKDRVAQQQEIAARIVAIDDDIALKRIERRRQQASVFSQVQAQADAEEQGIRKAQLDAQYAQDLFKEGISNEEKLAISRQYLQNKEELENEYADRARERSKEQAETGLGYASQALSTIGDFQKIASDKELAKADKDKKARLAKLDQEYKAGAISKDAYEAQKASIEANYDAKTRQIKKDAAEKEKALNIAQAVIAGALSVIKASPNIPLMIASGLVAAAGVAKIIATPIPEFAKGGVVGAPKPTWREKVRQFATGGRINAKAGVPDVGQRHSGGGIRMVDGATGEHLGEWERGEPYMILSRDTYANNKHLVDELIDTSLYRSGAPVRPRPGYYEDGGVSGGGVPGLASPGAAAGQELVEAMRETRDAVRALPSRQRIAWSQDDTAYLEDELNDRADVRAGNAIR